MILILPLLEYFLEIVDDEDNSVMPLLVEPDKALEAALNDNSISLLPEALRQRQDRLERKDLAQLGEQCQKEIRQRVLTGVLFFGEEYA